MKFVKIIFYLLVFSMFSCKNETKKSLLGVWIMEYRIDSESVNDSTDYSNYQESILVDFKQNNKMVLKNFEIFDTIYNWSVNSDSILTIAEMEYKITNLTTDNLSLLEVNGNETMLLRRPIDAKISLNIEEIEAMLKANIWSGADSITNVWDSKISFFDQNAMIIRYKPFDLDFQDFVDNMQLETWGLVNYDDQIYFYNRHDMSLGNGNFNSAGQLIHIDSNQYSISDFNGQEETLKYVSEKSEITDKKAKNDLLGFWVSTNYLDSNYGVWLPESQIESGRIQLYEEDLVMEISSDKITFIIENVQAKECGWQVGLDGKTVLLEYQVNEDYVQGIHFEYFDILERSKDHLKVRIYENRFYTGKEKPNGYLLNLIQDFRKID